jgi:hypothetical protein
MLGALHTKAFIGYLRSVVPGLIKGIAGTGSHPPRPWEDDRASAPGGLARATAAAPFDPG